MPSVAPVQAQFITNLPATAAVLLVAGVMLVFALRSLRAQRLKERYALVFVLIALPFVAIAAWPDALPYLAGAIGIDYRSFALMLVTVLFIVLNTKLLSIISVQDRRITTLAQHVAMLEARLDEHPGLRRGPDPTARRR